MVKYFSPEWGVEFCKAINSNEKYQKAAATWEGDFIFVSTSDEGDIHLYMDLWHGECRGTKKVGPDDTAEFVITGPYEQWVKVAKKEADPIQLMMVGELKLEGDMTKIMRATKAAVELVNSISMVEGTEF
ncbi:MAG: SCP2 sterol-binding domain-containing protein [Candidatus Helarchaeota archaeon]